MKNTKLPEFLRPYFWSYDLDKLDKEAHKELIIMHVLNYGDEKAVAWARENYTPAEIRYVVTHPPRGIWERWRLKAWLNELEEIIDPIKFEVAVKDIRNPRIGLLKAFWKRVDEEKGHAFLPTNS